MAGRLHSVTQGALRTRIESGGYRHFLSARVPERPEALYVLGARVPPSQDYDPTTKVLRVRVDAAEGARLRFGIYASLPVRAVSTPGGPLIPFTRGSDQRLLVFEAAQTAAGVFQVAFE